MHDLTAVGGVMVQAMPTQGYSNNGMFNYNPKFFWLLSRSCLYRFLDMRVDVGRRGARLFRPISPTKWPSMIR